MGIELRPVTPDDYRFLFDLLKEKTPEENISHRRMPTWEEHVAFNDAQPYAEDYIIVSEGRSVGRCYLTRGLNEVGIHVGVSHRRRGIASEVLDLLIARGVTLHANIAPRNYKSISLFGSKGFRLVQHTFRLDPGA